MARTYRGEDPEVVAAVDAAKGERFRRMAEEWRARNEGTWWWMVGKARLFTEQHRRFSIARLVEEARYTQPVEGVDEYRINSDIRAPLARMLVREVPECADYIRMRDSVVDICQE